MPILSVELQIQYDGHLSPDVFRIGEATHPSFPQHNFLSRTHTDTHSQSPQNLVNKSGGF